MITCFRFHRHHNCRVELAYPAAAPYHIVTLVHCRWRLFTGLNFEVEHFFTALAEGQTITCVAYFASGRFLTASENNVVFWVKRAVTLTGAKGTYDGNGLFVTDDEFVLDAPCVAAQVTIDDETSDEMAVCSSGTVVFCAAETLAQ